MRPYRHLNATPLKPNKFWVKQSPQYKRQEKFKGIRVWAYITPEGTTLITRGGKDCTRNFPHLAKLTSPGHVVDCELWQLGVEDEVIAGWANSTYLCADTSGVQLQCFDCVQSGDKVLLTLPLEERDCYREEAHSLVNDPNFLCVPYLTGDPDEDFAAIVERGGEGQMYKNMKSEYLQRAGDNRPSGYWFKEKSVENYDVVVMGFTEAKPGKFQGLIGAFTYGMMVGDALIRLGNCSGMTLSIRMDMTENPLNYLGEVLEVKAAGQDGNSGALIEPRYIRNHPSKQPHECVWR